MLKVYEMNLNVLKDEEVLELAKTDKYCHINNQLVLKQQIAKDKLLSFMMEKEGINSEIEKTKSGKPYFINSDLHFNITHSDNLVLIALSDEEIGIDAQMMCEIDELKLDKISKRIYNDNDYNYFFLSDSLTFSKIWTIKEAFLKCVGLGLIDNFHDIFVDYVKKEICYGKYSNLKYYSFRRDNYLIAIVCNAITKSTQKDIKENIITYKED